MAGVIELVRIFLFVIKSDADWRF